MRLNKPSPAMLVALLALFVALGGSSYAALQLPRGSVGTKQLKNGAVTSKKVKNDSLLVRDFRASQRSLLRGPRGERGPQGERGLQGSPGAPGPAGTARAYALIATGTPPTFKRGRVQNITAVSRAATGIYCLTLAAGIDASAIDPSVTVDWDFSSGNNLLAMIDSSHNDCPGNQVEVNTFIWPAGGNAAFSNDVDFFAVVP